MTTYTICKTITSKLIVEKHSKKITETLHIKEKNLKIK